MLRGSRRLLSENVADARDLVASIAAVGLAGVLRVARACAGVAHGIERTRADVMQPCAKVDLSRVVELVECSYQPRTRAIVAVEVVVGGGIGKSGVALGTVATARGAAGVLDGEHLYARLHPARPREIEHATRR